MNSRCNARWSANKRRSLMNPDISKLIRTHYLDLAGYVSAGMEVVKRDDLVFMNANENPYELPDLESYNRYPQPQPQTLLEAYAHTYGCDTDNIIMTRGADEALVILTKLFCEPHKDKVLINPPTFGMYKVDAQSMPAGVVSVPLLKDGGTFVLDKDQIIKQATNESQNIKLVYICSPNNPTGNSFDHKAIIEIVKALCGYAMVVLDETYAEFTAQGSLVPGLQDHPNLIILRTLSKSYSFAGMRMGCFLSGDEDFIKLVRAKALDAYPLPCESVKAALHVLSPEIKEKAQENIRKLIEDRKKLEKELRKSSEVIHIYPSDANFLLVRMKNASGFHGFAKEKGIILRDFSKNPETKDCLRISVGTPEQNDRLMEILSIYEKEKGTAG